MDAFAQGFEIRVNRTNNNSGMVTVLSVKLDKISPVERNQDAVGLRGEGQYVVVWYSLTRPATIQSCQHVMTQVTQILDNLLREISVRV